MSSYHESPDSGKGARPKEATPANCRAVGLSDPGCEREANEDRYLLCVRNEIAGYFVFDGMGGQPAGAAAAQISSDVVRDALRAFDKDSDLRLFMCHVINLAQEEVIIRSSEPGSAGMGTTVVGVLTRKSEVVVAAVGDSRAYHIKRWSVTQLTSDHTLVQQLVDAGKISPHDALVHPQSHILTRCVGSTLDFAIDSKRYRLKNTAMQTPEEWLLLCSDGLYSLVSEEEMRAIVTNFNPEEATAKLIALARTRGGFDNITAVVVPLLGCMVEAAPGASLPEDDHALSDSPVDKNYRAAFTRSLGRLVARVGLRQFAGLVAVVSALAVILSVVLFSAFTMR